MAPPPKPLKVFFHALDAVGHINACAGMGQAFAARGHKVTFLVNTAFRDRYEECAKFGFDIILLKRADQPAPPPEETDEEAKATRNKERAKKILASGVLSAKTPLEKLKNSVQDDSYVKSLYETAIEFHPQIADAIEREKPDLFISDHFLLMPAMLQAKIPWFHLHSSNPLGKLHSPKLPPSTSGMFCYFIF